MNLLLLPLLLLSLPLSSVADLATHKYEPGERIELFLNKVGPYANPHENYAYYTLPFCHPEEGHKTNEKKGGISIGEALGGHELRSSGFHVFFGVRNEKGREVICDQTLTQADVDRFSSAVREQYFYQMYFDDLPVWGMVGEPRTFHDPQHQGSSSSEYIYTEKKLSIAYNGNRVIEVNMTSDGLEPLEVGRKLSFSLTVDWRETDAPFHSRFERYLDNEFFEHQIHWFSIFNAFMMVIFLCGLVTLILVRTLRKDYQKYSSDGKDDDLESMERSIVEDTGWKQVHGDVFRPPAFLILFSALIGTGWQLFVLVGGVILFAVLGPIHGDVNEERGEVITSIIVCYTLSSVVSGYASGSYYKQFFTNPRAEAGSRWQLAMGVTIVLLPIIVVGTFAALDAVAMYYGTINAIPFMVILKVFGLWCFVSIPLAVVGTIFGRHAGGKNTFPCRINSIPRPIPDAPWYGNPSFLIPLAGVLPFGSIFIELYFVFTSYWNYKFYYVYGFMLLVFVILAIVTICSTVVAVYFTLNAENYRWQWTSFHAGGSTGFYVFVYAVYYFYHKTNMTGFLQTAFYFGYMGLSSGVTYLLCGSLGFYGSNVFVKTIFQNVKVD